MTNCKYCGHKSELPYGYTRKFCDNCISEKEIGATKILDYIFLKEYGKVLNSRIKEMERRVVVPDKSDPTGYHCGRLGDSGKVEERSPDYR